MTKKIEEAVNTVAGINSLYSRSYEGTSVVIVEFNLDVDGRKAADDVREKVVADPADAARRGQGAADLALRPAERADLQRRGAVRGRQARRPRSSPPGPTQVLQKRLENVRGVGSVSVVGGLARQINIYLKPAAMEALGIGADQVVAAVRSENQELPLGSIRSKEQERVVQINARIKRPEDFRDIVVARKSFGGAAAPRRRRLRSTAAPVRSGRWPTSSTARRRCESLALYNGQRTVLLSVQKSQGENTIEVVDGLFKALRGRQAADAARRQGRGQPRQLALDPGLGRQRQAHPVRRRGADDPDRLPVPQFLALDRHHRADAADRADRHVPVHVHVRLHDQHDHDDGAVALRRPADRRRDRGAGEHRPPRADGQERPRGRARRHQRDRPGGAGDHALDRRRVPADRLHGRHRRQVLPRVRPDDRRRGADLDVRQLHARPDAVERLARPAGRARPRRVRRRRPAHALRPHHRPRHRPVRPADAALSAAATRRSCAGRCGTGSPPWASPWPPSSPASSSSRSSAPSSCPRPTSPRPRSTTTRRSAPRSR